MAPGAANPGTESRYAMLSVGDALAIVLAQAQTLAAVTVPLPDALGRVLAEPVIARDPLPPFAASIKDGYAVCAADGPGDYPVVGEATAGRMPAFAVTPGSVAYITTGAPLPPGADAVVMVEETQSLPLRNGVPRVRIGKQVAPGADVRPIGYDVTVGEEVLAAGVRLGAAELGLLATVGQAEVAVVRTPRVAVLSTGDELSDLGTPLLPGKIRDSNRTTLLAAVAAAGGEPIDLGIAPDDRAVLTAQLEQGLAAADIVVTSGGVSMGNLDYIKPLLEQRGVVHFGRLLMKPGKPLTFATVAVEGQQKLVFGLPGNPVSSLVTFYLLAVPAIRKLGGTADPMLHRVRAVLAQPLALDPDRPEYHRVLLHWDPEAKAGQGAFVATTTGSQASSRLLSMRSANALLELPQGRGELPGGSAVDALLIGDL
jgi:gephyrin